MLKLDKIIFTLRSSSQPWNSSLYPEKPAHFISPFVFLFVFFKYVSFYSEGHSFKVLFKGETKCNILINKGTAFFLQRSL